MFKDLLHKDAQLVLVQFQYDLTDCVGSDLADLLFGEFSDQCRDHFRIQCVYLLFREPGKKCRQECCRRLFIDTLKPLRCQSLREASEQDRKRLFIQKCCRRGEFLLVFFAEFIDHGRQKFTALFALFFLLRSDHQLIQHDRKPLPALVLRHVLEDLSKKRRHFRGLIHRRIACLSCCEIHIDTIAGIHEHNIADPRFEKIHPLVSHFQRYVEVLHFSCFGLFLPFFDEVLRDRDRVAFA